MNENGIARINGAIIVVRTGNQSDGANVATPVRSNTKESKMKYPIYKLPLILCVIGALFALSGCDQARNPMSDTSGGATYDDRSDAVEDFGATVAGQDEAMPEMWGTESGSPNGTAVAAMVREIPRICDTTYYRHGLTITIDRTYYSADSQASEKYDPETSVWVTRHVTITGTWNGLLRSAAINHDGTVRVDGIAPNDTIRILNGTGKRTVESKFEAKFRKMQRTVEATHSWQIRNVRFNRDRDTYPYPLSGSISVETIIKRKMVKNYRTVTVDIDVDYTVFFDGTEYAKVVVVDGPNFWIDLKDGSCDDDHP